MQISEHWISSDGGGLFARRWRPDGAGDAGPTILLFHDSLGCVELWRDFPQALAAATGRTVIAYDRLGFGRSAANPRRLALDFVEAEAQGAASAILRHFAVGRFVALGHSVGGGMAIATAAAFPDICDAVVTIAAQAFVEDRTLAGIRDAQRQFDDPAQMARLGRYHGDKTAWVLDAWIGSWLDPGFAGWTLDRPLSRLGCPILAIHGDRDEYGSRAHPDRIAALAGGRSAMALIEDCGHVPHRERPDLTLPLAAAFIAGPETA